MYGDIRCYRRKLKEGYADLSALYFLKYVFFKYLLIYLAVLGLSCSTWDLSLCHVNSFLQCMGSSSLTRD